jgi:hypothetical protein
MVLKQAAVAAGFVVLSACAAASSYRLPINGAEAPRYFQPIGVCAGEAGLTSIQHPSSVNVKYNDSVWIQYMVQGEAYNMVVVGEDPALEAKKKGDEIFSCAQGKGPGEMPVQTTPHSPVVVEQTKPLTSEPDPVEPVKADDSGEMACTLDTQCPKHNCTKGYCRTNEPAALCVYDTHCNSHNCTNGVCQTNAPGAACQYDTHCTSHNCTNKTCQTNARGAACQFDTHCTSGNCTKNMCQ